MLQILLCDDDTAFLERLADLTGTFFEKRGIPVRLHSFSQSQDIGSETLKACDLALLDIDYAGERHNGIDLARRLRQTNTDAVLLFITSYIEFAPEGYEVQAFRYLMKSEITGKLEQCLQQALACLRRAVPLIHFLSGGEMISLSVQEILYVESMGHSLIYHTTDGKAYSVYSTLTKAEEELSERGFLRIQKSFLVNMGYLKKLSCREALLKDGRMLPVSEKHYSALKQQFLLWKGSH